MQKLRYHLVDVFTNRAFGGNQLAVFTNGHHLNADQMQRIARELNLSETTYVMPPRNDETDFWVRIFTPGRELPIAGHPTVGTAFVLAREAFIDPPEDSESTIVKFEEGVGTVPVSVEFDDGEPGTVTMDQPISTFGDVFENRPLLAEILSINAGDLDERYPAETVSSGIPYLVVPLKSRDAVGRVKLRLDLWEQHLKDSDAAQVFVFTQETEQPDSTVHCRMFAPAFGIPEDPATGSAGGPLGCYLLKHSIVKSDGRAHIVSEQGFDMGRPSLIDITIDHAPDGTVKRVQVGGQCVAVGEGYIYEDLFF